MATNLIAKSASHLFVATAFRNGLEYRNADGRVNSGNDLATSYKNLINFGLLTHSGDLFAHLRTYVDSKIRQKLGYPAKYLRMYSTNPHKIFRVGGLWVGCHLFCGRPRDVAMVTN